MKQLLKVLMVLVFTWASTTFAENLVEGKDYKVIRSDGDRGDVVQVYEFFNYACGHCYEFQPLIESWAQNPPKGVQFNYMPAVFNERMIPLAKLYFTLEEMQLLKTVHQEVYDAIHRKGVSLMTDKKILKWIDSNDRVDNESFNKLYKSFGIDAKVKKAVQLTRSYRVPGTPYVTVKGKYITGPSMALRSDGSGVDAVRFIAILNTLVAKD